MILLAFDLFVTQTYGSSNFLDEINKLIQKKTNLVNY